MDRERCYVFYIYFFFNLLISAGYQDKFPDFDFKSQLLELILTGKRFFHFLFLSL